MDPSTQDYSKRIMENEHRASELKRRYDHITQFGGEEKINSIKGNVKRGTDGVNSAKKKQKHGPGSMIFITSKLVKKQDVPAGPPIFCLARGNENEVLSQSLSSRSPLPALTIFNNAISSVSYSSSQRQTSRSPQPPVPPASIPFISLITEEVKKAVKKEKDLAQEEMEMKVKRESGGEADGEETEVEMEEEVINHFQFLKGSDTTTSFKNPSLEKFYIKHELTYCVQAVEDEWKARKMRRRVRRYLRHCRTKAREARQQARYNKEMVDTINSEHSCHSACELNRNPNTIANDIPRRPRRMKNNSDINNSNNSSSNNASTYQPYQPYPPPPSRLSLPLSLPLLQLARIAGEQQDACMSEDDADDADWDEAEAGKDALWRTGKYEGDTPMEFLSDVDGEESEYEREIEKVIGMEREGGEKGERRGEGRGRGEEGKGEERKEKKKEMEEALWFKKFHEYDDDDNNDNKDDCDDSRGKGKSNALSNGSSGTSVCRSYTVSDHFVSVVAKEDAAVLEYTLPCVPAYITVLSKTSRDAFFPSALPPPPPPLLSSAYFSSQPRSLSPFGKPNPFLIPMRTPSPQQNPFKYPVKYQSPLLSQSPFRPVSAPVPVPTPTSNDTPATPTPARARTPRAAALTQPFEEREVYLRGMLHRLRGYTELCHVAEKRRVTAERMRVLRMACRRVWTERKRRASTNTDSPTAWQREEESIKATEKEIENELSVYVARHCPCMVPLKNLDRNNMLHSVFKKHCVNKIPAYWGRLPLQIGFANQDGKDAYEGGLTKEYITMTLEQLADPASGLFVPISNTTSPFLVINPNSRLLFSPPNNNNNNISSSSSSSSSTTTTTTSHHHLAYFSLFGRLLATALINNIQVNLKFAPLFWKDLVRRPLCFNDLELYDEELYKTMRTILRAEDDELRSWEIPFSIPVQISLDAIGYIPLEDDAHHIPLVTKENRSDFVMKATHCKLRMRTREQMNSIRYAFNEVVPLRYLSSFTTGEVALLFVGKDTLDVADWKKNTDYRGGYKADSPVIVWFWEIVEKMMSEKDRVALLQFTTALTRLGSGGFGGLNKNKVRGCYPFTICRHKTGSDIHLPESHTCFNRLDLPDYSSLEITRERLQTLLDVQEKLGFERK